MNRLQFLNLNKRRAPDLWRNSFAGHPSLCQIPENMKHQHILCGSPHLRADHVGRELNRSSISIRNPVQITRRGGGRGGAVLGGHAVLGGAGWWKHGVSEISTTLPFALPSMPPSSPLTPSHCHQRQPAPTTQWRGGWGRAVGWVWESPGVEGVLHWRDQCRENQRRAGSAVCFQYEAFSNITGTHRSVS